MPQKLLQLYPLVKPMIKVSPGSVEGDTTLLLDGDGGGGDGGGPIQGGHMGWEALLFHSFFFFFTFFNLFEDREHK